MGNINRVTTATGGRRILVVDDNSDAANTTAVLLTTFGHEVEIANDGYSAIRIAFSFRPDIVLLDIGLPGLDGYAVAKRLRQDGSLNGMRIIAITGRGFDDDRTRSEEAGIDQDLVKPVDPRFLESLLRISRAP